MRHVKLLTTLVLIVALIFPYSVVNAYHSPSSADQDDTVESNGYTFHIETEETADHQVIRSYTLADEDHPTARSVQADTADRTKALLLAMGWDQEMVDSLSPEDLQDYASCKQITTTVSYIKENAQGDMENISEHEAISGAAAQNERPNEYSEVTYTSYMRLTHTVTYYGNAYYRFSADAIWLTMPVWRLQDSIGSCAPTLAIDNSTRSGYVKYDVICTDNGTVVMDETVTTGMTSIQNAINGDWYGSAGVFDMPADIISSYVLTLYSNLRAHYEFKAYLRYPEFETNFNSVATYCHRQILPVISPSISIDFNGDAAASIGLSFESSNDYTSAELLLHYTPA